ncbi:MAG TPA: DMT family transporter [Burkholderiaceae bacterium]|nr:DMT family transporter [Burkholderiaceae bacterium]
MQISSTSGAATVRAANRRGIAAMSLAMAGFVANDSLVKLVSETLPSAQLIFIRGLFATMLLLVVAQAMGSLRPQQPGAPAGGVRVMLQRPVLVRALLDALATLTYLTSLFHLPIGNATAINMATPLFITLFAVLAFHERVGPARWLAVAAGFAGVLLVVQPSAAGFNAYALLCLVGTLFHAGRDLMTRTIHHSVPSVLITLATAVAVTLLSGVLSAVQGWQPVGARQLGQLAAASVFLSVGYYLIIVGMRSGEMSVIAPFRYTGLLFALAIGWAIWGDVPNALAWAGIALLVGAGLYVLHSERERARAGLEAAAD